MDVASLHAELLLVPAADGRPLEAAYFDAPSPAGALVVHGKGGNCYSGVSRFVAAGLNRAGYRVLSLNMRCHDLGYSRPDIEPEGHLGHAVDGGMWEDLDLGHIDLAAGIGELRRRGVRHVVLVGHSSGGFYIAEMAERDPDIAAFVFLSPLLTNLTAIPGWFPGPGEAEVAYMTAASMIVDGKGHQLIPLPVWYYAISARSLKQRMDEQPGRFEAAMQATRAPVLMVAGSRETRLDAWRSTTARLPSPDRDFVVIAGAEHNYLGQEDEVIGAITGFLGRHVPA